jgi:hypothetical protein
MRPQGTKISFHVSQDEDNYPPVSAEALVVKPVGQPDEPEIAEIPFYVREATLGDIVRVETDDDGVWWYIGMVQRSGNSLLRIVFFESQERVRIESALTNQGCQTAFLEHGGLLAVNVPPSTSLAAVQALLASESARGVLDYEEPLLRQ